MAVTTTTTTTTITTIIIIIIIIIVIGAVGLHKNRKLTVRAFICSGRTLSHICT
jgi:hypothetical protein